MAEDKKEPWLNYLALTTIILAVAATLSTSKGGSYSTRSVLSQTQAANQWAYYQAKSVKSYLYEVQKDELELELQGPLTSQPPAVVEVYRKKLDNYRQQLERYSGEKEQIQTEARHLEKVRDDAQAHARTFGSAVVFLQVAILLSSVAALLRKKPLWYLGLAPGVVGLVYFVNGFLMVKV